MWMVVLSGGPRLRDRSYTENAARQGCVIEVVCSTSNEGAVVGG